MRRLAAAAAVLFTSALLGATIAQADATFVLSETAAKAGDTVHFSIGDSENIDGYAIEVADREVAESSELDGDTASVFTMPDLGDSSRTVAVELTIKRSDETTTLTRSLTYLAADGSPTGARLDPPYAAGTSSGPVNGEALLAGQQRRAGRSAQGKRRARRSPSHTRRRSSARRVRERQRLTPSRHIRRSGRIASASTTRRRDPSAKTPSAPSGRSSSPSPKERELTRSHGSGGSAVAQLTTFLTAPPAGDIFSAATAAAGNGGTDFPATAAIVLPLLCLSALLLAGGRITPTRRSARFLFIPGSSSTRDAPRPPTADDFLEPDVALDERQALTSNGNAQQPALDLAAIAAPFEMISLAALEQHAELATRSERKYILESAAFEALIGALVPHYLILEIGGARVFSYDTVYFDTPSRITYRHHVQRRRRRYKVRSRSYSESGPSFFEVKLKGNRGETIKKRVPSTLSDHGVLTDESTAFLQRVLRENYGLDVPAGFAPVLNTTYRRLTLVGRTSSDRITFDFDLMFAANDLECSIQPGRVLVETKADVAVGDRNTGTGAARKALRELGARPVQSCSKYCLGVALTHSGLRDNPFRSLIANHFDPTRRDRAYERTRAQAPAEPAPERLPAVLVTPSREGFLQQFRRGEISR
jgi:hypothetical protein